jgi:hypothetical protein
MVLELNCFPRLSMSKDEDLFKFSLESLEHEAVGSQLVYFSKSLGKCDKLCVLDHWVLIALLI